MMGTKFIDFGPVQRMFPCLGILIYDLNVIIIIVGTQHSMVFFKPGTFFSNDIVFNE